MIPSPFQPSPVSKVEMRRRHLSGVNACDYFVCVFFPNNDTFAKHIYIYRHAKPSPGSNKLHNKLPQNPTFCVKAHSTQTMTPDDSAARMRECDNIHHFRHWRPNRINCRVLCCVSYAAAAACGVYCAIVSSIVREVPEKTS